MPLSLDKDTFVAEVVWEAAIEETDESLLEDEELLHEKPESSWKRKKKVR